MVLLDGGHELSLEIVLIVGGLDVDHRLLVLLAHFLLLNLLLLRLLLLVILVADTNAILVGLHLSPHGARQLEVLYGPAVIVVIVILAVRIVLVHSRPAAMAMVFLFVIVLML